MMQNVELVPKANINALKISTFPNMASEPLCMYMSTLASNTIAWLWKALEADKRLSLKLTKVALPHHILDV